MVVFMQRFNVTGCQKTVSETKYYLSTTIDRPTCLLTLISVQRILSFNISLILYKNNIMLAMRKLKFMQEFTFAINVECLHSNLRAKLLMHNCARVNHAKTCFCSI